MTTVPSTVFSSAQSNAATSVVVGGDAGLQAGDFRVVWITVSPGPVTVTPPSGWATLYDVDLGTDSTRRHYIFTRFHQVGDPANYTFTFSISANFGMTQTASRGVDPTNPVDVGPVHATDLATPYVAPSATTTVANTLLLCFFGVTVNSTTVTVTTPSGMTSLVAQSGTGTAGHAVRLAKESRPTAGATGTRSASGGNSRWIGSMLALRPVPDLPPGVTVRETIPFSGYTAGAGNSTATANTGAGTQVGDMLVLFDGSDYATTSGDDPAPTGTAGTWDNGGFPLRPGTTNKPLLNTWTRMVTVAGAQAVTITGGPADTGVHGVLYVLSGASLAVIDRDVAASAANTSVWSAPSVTGDVDDLLLCGWQGAYNANTAPVIPGSMSNILTTPVADASVLTSAREVLAAAGLTGVRTATPSTARAYAGASIVVRSGGAGAPPAAFWVADAESNDFSHFADTSAGTGGIDYLTPQTRAIVTYPVRSGDRAYEFAVNGVASNTTQRSESRALDVNFVEGDDLWFAGSSYLPVGFPVSPGSWQVVWQWKNSFASSPPLSVVVQDGAYRLSGGFGHPSGDMSMPLKNLGAAVAGEWADWLFRVVFSSDSAVGSIQVWRNGVEVLAPYKPPGGTMYPSQTSYFKIGLYRDPNLSFGPSTRVYHDEWRIGAARGSVEVLGSIDSRRTPLYGLDVSHFRAGLNLATAQNEGMEFVVAKIGQGSSTAQGFGQTLDAEWPNFRNAARSIGMYLAGYWYLGDTETPESQAQRCRDYIGELGIPVFLDWEDGGGAWSNVSACVTAFRAVGLTVRALYTRSSYHAANSGGSLSDLNLSLWNARYPVTTSGTPIALYENVESALDTYWQSYGNVNTSILQFSDNSTIAANSPVDANAFDGNEAELKALFDPAPQGANNGGAFLSIFI